MLVSEKSHQLNVISVIVLIMQLVDEMSQSGITSQTGQIAQGILHSIAKRRGCIAT